MAGQGLHAWLTRPLSDWVILDAKLVTAWTRALRPVIKPMMRAVSGILASVLEPMANNGLILEAGLICGRHQTLCLMRQNALKARPKRRKSWGR